MSTRYEIFNAHGVPICRNITEEQMERMAERCERERVVIIVVPQHRPLELMTDGGQVLVHPVAEVGI